MAPHHKMTPKEKKRIALRKRIVPSKSESLTFDATELNAEASNKLFSYLSENRIRLINLYPGCLDDEIKCSVQEATLSDPSLSYYALSYVWGTFDEESYIELNGERFRVTKNLAEALRRLRQADQIETIWIDALCINQTDKKEKDTQVPLMGSIYKTAKKVVAFLGKHDETSPILFRVLKDLERRGDTQLALNLLDFEELSTLIPALHTFLRRGYWTRAWVVQELVLARDKWIQCEYDRVLYSTLEAFQESIMSYLPLITISPMGPVHIRGVAYSNEWHSRFPQLGSMEKELSTNGFLEGFLDVRCSNPRDHIYAFYNLLDSNIQNHIEVDYEKRPAEIIYQAAKGIIMETQSLHIITLRGRQVWPLEAWQYTMPSWCPFFGVPYINDSLPPRDYTRPYITEGIAKFSTDGKVMHVKGVVLGIIYETVPRIPLVHHPFNNISIKDKARVDDELEYAYKCIEFIEARADNDVELNCTVLGDIMAGEDGLLSYLKKTSELGSARMSRLNDFARYFISRQLSFFSAR
ncbi:hypothetical protein AWENTII_010861 [Aspergillus wentii]